MPGTISRSVKRSLVIGSLLLFVGCDQTITDLEKPQDPRIQQILDLGFRADMIEDMGSYYRVDGDIIFEKADLSTRDGLKPSFQATTTALLARSSAGYIVVDLSRIAAYPEWVTASRQAMTEWSNLSGQLIRFKENVPYGPQITVTAYTQVCTTCTIAQASFPNGGQPGKTIQINVGYRGGLGPGGVPTAASKKHIMAHEFGHTVGFRHTDWLQNGESASPYGANTVPGTSSSDGASIMIARSGNRDWAGFSFYDRVAIRKTYLGFGPVPTGSVQSGRPRLDWPAMTEAQSYNVRYVTPRFDPELGYWIDGTDVFVGSTTALAFVDNSRAATRVGACTDGSPGYYVQTNFPAGITSYGWGGRICFF